MAYAVNWLTKVITIPTTDLDLVSGTRYSLTMSDCLAEVRRLEWQFDQGLWAPAILGHDNTRFDFAGTDYFPFDEFINGYTVEITGAATRVDLLGSNNNLVDVLIPNGVTVVPSNSAGNSVVTVISGSGLSASEQLRLQRIEQILRNTRFIDQADGKAKVLTDDDLAVLMEGLAFEDSGQLQAYRGQGVERVNRLEDVP